MFTIEQFPLSVLAVICLFASGLGYLEGNQTWLKSGILSHLALTVACLATFGLVSVLSGLLRAWTACLLFGAVLVGCLESRPSWMRLGFAGAFPLPALVAWGYGG